MGAALCVLAGIVTAGVGVLLLIPTVRFAVAARSSADGRVIAHDQSDTPEATWYYPRVQFRAEGREWMVRGQLGKLRPRPPLGSHVRVTFPPGDPRAAQLGRFGGVLASLGLLGLGIALALGAIWELVRG
jgi:hypothetical protein